jgi:hypothetical protein
VADRQARKRIGAQREDAAQGRRPGHAGEYRWLGELTFLDDTEFDPEAIRLSHHQIESHGAGLIADYQHPSGGWFMAWVE